MITNNSSEVKNHWNKIGDNYQNFWHSPAQKIMSQDETGFIKCHILNRFTDILDLGCGNGRILEALIQKSRNDSNIYGLDISSKMIEYCKEKFQKEKKIKELQVLDDNRNLDVYKKKFDLITSIRVMKYNKNWEEMLLQLFGFLNKEGIIIFSMPNRDAITRFLKTDITYIRVSPSYIKKIAHENNMKILEIRGFSRIPDFLYNINNSFISRLIVFGEKLLGVIFGKYFLCREVFYVLSK